MTELSERVSQMTPLKQALLKIEELQTELSKQKQRDAIAVIGMGCRFPSANNPDEFCVFYLSLLTDVKDYNPGIAINQ